MTSRVFVGYNEEAPSVICVCPLQIFAGWDSFALRGLLPRGSLARKVWFEFKLFDQLLLNPCCLKTAPRSATFGAPLMRIRRMGG